VAHFDETGILVEGGENWLLHAAYLPHRQRGAMSEFGILPGSVVARSMTG
jgi:hypothetical protein